MTHRQRQHIDYFIDMRADEVRPEDEVGVFVDQHLEPVNGLGHSPRRIPGRCFLALDTEVQAFRPGLYFADSN